MQRSRRRRLTRMPLAVCASFLVALPVDAAIAASDQWTLVSVQAPSTRVDTLNFANIVCTGPSDCWAPGYGTAAGRPAGVGQPSTAGIQAVLEHWTGSQFKIVPTPVADAPLGGMTCPGAADCWLATDQRTKTGSKALMEHWDGAKWSTADVPTPATTYSYLSDVSCPSSHDCYAVGESNDTKSGKALLEHWNGNAWSMGSVPSPSGMAFSYLSAIRCLSATWCMATGEASSTGKSTLVAGPPPHAFAERYDGKSWSMLGMPVPAPEAHSEVMINALDCPSTNDCVAVGTNLHWPDMGLDPGNAVAEHWDGSHWSLIALRLYEAHGSANTLNDVSCPGPSLCWAVGATFTDVASSPAVTAVWSGNSFTLGTNANPGEANVLSAVGCMSGDGCLGIGYSSSPAGTAAPLAEFHPLGHSAPGAGPRRR